MLCGCGGLAMNMFTIFCLVVNANMVMKNIKIYCTLKCGSDGLVMTKICKFFIILT